MKTLKEITKLVENNAHCVILEVIGSQLDLIKLGYFDGDEKYLRLTKGDTITCTVIKNDGSSYSWHWGLGGYTCVSDAMSKRGRIISNCIQKDYGIFCSKYA